MKLQNLKYKWFRPKPTSDEKLLKELVALNKDAHEAMDGFGIRFNEARAVQTMKAVRDTLTPYGLGNEMAQTVAAEVSHRIETMTATAAKQEETQQKQYSHSVSAKVLAQMSLAEDILGTEGDVYAAIVSPIELGMNSNLWVRGSDPEMVKDINGLLRAWNVTNTVNDAWLDMETYSAFYLTHVWAEGVPSPIHWSPKQVAVGPSNGLGAMDFTLLSNPTPSGAQDEQLLINFYKTFSNREWNDFKEQGGGQGIPLDKNFTWGHLLKWRHKKYPIPWVSKGATPVYTRQIIEEMRLALVMGVMSQLTVMTLEEPMSGELSRLKQIISANRAERVGFLIWRSGLKVDTYGPESIEQLLMPEAWWAATLDVFRRIGRPIRIVAGESPQRGASGSSDGEIDIRLAQNKAMAHRKFVADKVVLDLLRQWATVGGGNKSVIKALSRGEISVQLSPISLFLGEDLKNIWGPQWDRGMASIHTIHTAMGLDTEYESAMMEAEEKEGLDEIYIARQQFAQRVASPDGEVTRSTEPGKPEGEPQEERQPQEAKAAYDPKVEEQLLEAFDEISQPGDENKESKIMAFIALLTSLIGIHMKTAYAEGYQAGGGWKQIDDIQVRKALDWEYAYINNFEDDMLAAAAQGQPLTAFRRRVEQHATQAWKYAYMAGVWQAKIEDGWRYWQRVLQPWRSASGPCEICREDSKVWHPMTEPFWDHPDGVCSVQMVRFMQTSADGWQSISPQMIDVPIF